MARVEFHGQLHGIAAARVGWVKLDQSLQQTFRLYITLLRGQPLRSEVDRVTAKLGGGSHQHGWRVRLLLGGVAGRDPPQHPHRQGGGLLNLLMHTVEQIKRLRPQLALRGGIKKLQQLLLRQRCLVQLQKRLYLEQQRCLVHALPPVAGPEHRLEHLLGRFDLPALQQSPSSQKARGRIICVSLWRQGAGGLAFVDINLALQQPCTRLQRSVPGIQQRGNHGTRLGIFIEIRQNLCLEQARARVRWSGVFLRQFPAGGI